MMWKKQANNSNGAVLNRDFPRRSRSVFCIGYPWDIIKNVPSEVSAESWDKVGIYSIVSLGWSGEMAENGM